MKANKRTISSLRKLSLERVFTQLEDCIEGEKASALFVCGGKMNAAKQSSQPVRCSWTPKNDSNSRWLRLPVASDDSMIDQLAADCKPVGAFKGQVDSEYQNVGELKSLASF